VLERLIRECEHAHGRLPCPIIATLLQAAVTAPPAAGTRGRGRAAAARAIAGTA
jgi:hypothetical protein